MSQFTFTDGNSKVAGTLNPDGPEREAFTSPKPRPTSRDVSYGDRIIPVTEHFIVFFNLFFIYLMHWMTVWLIHI